MPVVVSPITFSSIYQQAEKINSVREVNNQLIDWNEVKTTLPLIIKNIESFNKDAQTIFMKKIQQIINEAKNNNLNLEQLIKKISIDSKKFKNSYSEIKSQINNANLHSYIENQNSLKSFNYSQTEPDKLNKLVNHLKISKVTFITTSATAAVAAAGFYAAAPLTFGATVPWAVGCTTVSAVSGSVAASISIALVKYDDALSDWQTARGSMGAIVNLGTIFYRVLNPILIGATATITATSWAFPAAFALIPIMGSILTWINLYKVTL